MDLKRKYLRVKQRLFPEIITSRDMLYLLRSAGVPIGKGTIFYHPGRTMVDASRPCLLEIGEYCKITSGVIILTHDYSRSVLRRAYGELVGEGAKTVIGDNVFIGMNAIILMGSHIGSNVIVGAGSVVSGSIPDNVVIAGNPARIIRTLGEYNAIRRKRSMEEAVAYVRHFEARYKRKPTIKEMDPFYCLFLPRDQALIDKYQISFTLGGDNTEEVKRAFMNSKPIFDGYEAFLSFCEESEV
jgi:carbonic anhydrase/acetyltransferase-like protein (isoleucine patch superfamily)